MIVLGVLSVFSVEAHSLRSLTPKSLSSKGQDSKELGNSSKHCFPSFTIQNETQGGSVLTY